MLAFRFGHLKVQVEKVVILPACEWIVLGWRSHGFGVVIVVEGGIEVGLGFDFVQFGLEGVFVMRGVVVMGIDVGEQVVVLVFSQESL